MLHPEPTTPEESRRGVVLYVDDEEPNRLVFEIEFEDDFEVLCAASGAEALEIMQQRMIDVLVTDFRMPGMSGVELCEQAARIAPDIHRLLVTAFSDTQTATEAINRGRVTRYIPKPWEPEDIASALRDAIRDVDLKRSVSRLQAEMARRERDIGLAAAQSRFLHDLANMASAVAMATGGLEEVEPQVVRTLPPELAQGFSEDLAQLRAAVHVMMQVQASYQKVRTRQEPKRELLRVEGLLRMVTLVARAKLAPGLRLETHAEPGLEAFGNESDLARILVNLVVNAAQAITASGQEVGCISVRARAPEAGGRWLEVEVTDDGPGIPDAIRDRLFEPFITTKNHAHGSGLGLSICRELAEQNGGALRLASTAAGRGTTFVLKLRAALPNRRVGPAPEQQQAAR